MYKYQRLALTTSLAALLLASCTSPDGPQASGIEAPSLWTRLLGDATPTPDGKTPVAIDAATVVDQEWWKHFGDPTLNTLIDEAIRDNKTLEIARERITEARADRGVARSLLYPQISLVGDASRGNQGYNTNNQNIGLADADIEATWDIDLFGHQQALTAQATAILQSQQASQQAIRVSLLAEVARNYFDMRNYERQIALTKQNLETEEKTLELTKAQFKGALASDFDVQRAGAQVSTTEALIPALETAYDGSLNRLNVLFGKPPGSRDALLKTEEKLNPLDQHILIAAPATVLATRPDVRVAERQFAATISESKAAEATLFPDISLTGLFGLQTATPFTATPWAVGVQLVQPLVNFGRISSQIDAADSQQRQAFLNYQETVLEALENMENALSSYVHETTRNASLTTAVQQTSKANDLAQQQYSNGYTSLLDVLVAQRNLLDAEASQATSDANLRKYLVNIYTAAGGGWDVQDSAVRPN